MEKDINMNYLAIKDNKVVGEIATKKYPVELFKTAGISFDKIVERGESAIVSGEDVRFYNSDLTIKKDLSVLIKEKLVEVPKGKKLVGNEFVEKTIAEKVKDKEIVLEKNQKLEKDQIVLKSIDELFKEKTITKDEYNDRQRLNRAGAYLVESDPLYMEWQFDQTEEAKKIWVDKIKEIKNRYKLK